MVPLHPSFPPVTPCHRSHCPCSHGRASVALVPSQKEKKNKKDVCARIEATNQVTGERLRKWGCAGLEAPHRGAMPEQDDDDAESIASSGWGDGSAAGEGRRVRKVKGPKTNKPPPGDQQQVAAARVCGLLCAASPCVS